MHITPLTNHTGCIVTDLDLSTPLDNDTLAELRSVWLRYLVIFIRGQQLTPQQQMDFAGQIGEADTYPFLNGLSGYPQITEVLKKEDETINFGGVWHTDTIYQNKPPMATMLYAIDLPPVGGDTIFANQYAAYDSLSTGLKNSLHGLRAISKAGNKAVAATRTARINDQGTPTQADNLHGEHPVVRTHPETQKHSLFVSPAHTTQIDGWHTGESTALLKMLFDVQTQPDFTCRFRWQEGDLALWDNRCTLHFPVNDYHGFLRRLHRITLKGDVPV